MVRLQVLAGDRTGVCFSSAQFPIRVGRAAESDFVLDEPGVWPRHFSIQREENELVIHVGPEALLCINGAPVQQAALRNGDVISFGGIKLQFGFTPVRQSSLKWRERLTWAALAGLALGEIAVAYILW
jgi:pSer/pThr/pTyr-binding forkhead associated (FHA) protein